MKTKYSMINVVASLSFQIITIIIGFFVPRLIIVTYGAEVNGLSSNFSQVINIINLLQAGLVGASIFEMYKPITEQDNEKIGSIFYSSSKYFSKMSYVFFLFILLSIPYMLNVESTELRNREIICSVLILGINATIGFRYYCKYDVIFSANQEKYILILSSALEKTIYYVLVFLGIYLRIHFIWIYVFALVGTIAKILYLNYKFRQQFESRIISFRENDNYKVKHQFHLFGNQVIQNLIDTAPMITVTSLYGFKSASIYSIYMLVGNFFKTVFSTLQNAIAASFGLLVAEGNRTKVLEVFKVIQIAFCMLTLVLFSCVSVLLPSFINIYSNDIADFSYVYRGLAIVISIYLVCNISFLSFNLMINSLGLYGKVLKANIVCGVVTVLLTGIFSYLDFQLGFLSSALFYFSAIFHRYFILKSNGVRLTPVNLIISVLPVFVTLIESYFMIHAPLVSSISTWIEYGCISFVISCVCVFSLSMLVWRKEMKIIFDRLRAAIKR